MMCLLISIGLFYGTLGGIALLWLFVLWQVITFLIVFLDEDNHEEDPDGIQKLLQSSLSPRHSPIPFHHQLRQSIRSSMLKEVSYHMQINYDIYLRHPQTYYVAKMVS